MKKNARIALGATIALSALAVTFGPVSAATAATAATESPAVVIDGGEMLTAAQEADLTRSIDAADKRYKLEFVVETIPSLDGRDIQQLATQRANELGVGSAAENNGVYTLIARDDHGIQIALGSGVDDKVSDATVERIIADDMTPAFREEQYVSGIEAAQAEIGDYYTSDRAATEAAQQREQEAETGRVVGTVVGVILWVVGGAVALLVLGGLIWLTKVLIEYVRDERERKVNIRHREAIESLTGELYELSDAERAEFHALADDAAREAWLAPRLEKYLVKDADFADELYSAAVSAYVATYIGEIEKEQNMRWSRQRPYRFDARGVSLAAFFTKFVADSKQEKVRQREEAKSAEIRQAAERKRQQEAAAERAKQQAKEEAEAKRAWKKLTAEQKSAVKSARTRRDKERVLAGYGVSSSDLAVWFPVWLAVYASEVGQPQSNYSSSSSSRSSSSSSSSSYSSSDYGSSSSFGGGSFDGGGGGGSW